MTCRHRRRTAETLSSHTLPEPNAYRATRPLHRWVDPLTNEPSGRWCTVDATTPRTPTRSAGVPAQVAADLVLLLQDVLGRFEVAGLVGPAHHPDHLCRGEAGTDGRVA